VLKKFIIEWQKDVIQNKKLENAFQTLILTELSIHRENNDRINHRTILREQLFLPEQTQIIFYLLRISFLQLCLRRLRFQVAANQTIQRAQ